MLSLSFSCACGLLAYFTWFQLESNLCNYANRALQSVLAKQAQLRNRAEWSTGKSKVGDSGMLCLWTVGQGQGRGQGGEVISGS